MSIPRSMFHVAAALVSGIAAPHTFAQFTGYQLSNGATQDSKVFAVGGGVLGGFSVPDLRPGIWPSVTSSFVSLWPGVPNIAGDVFAISGGRQFGRFGPDAAMWSGTAASYVSLNPPGATSSTMYAAQGDRQAGQAYFPSSPTYPQAMLWSGTAATAVSLQLPTMTWSYATSMSETQQGGQVTYTNGTSHAALWSGTAESVLDMNPPSVTSSNIVGMSAGQQVGWTDSLATDRHAALWTGTPESYRDLNPFPGSTSQLNDTCGSAQVGTVGLAAGIWFGTAQSFINLHQFLPPGASSSAATCIEEVNGVYTIGGFARYGLHYQAVAWVGVPAPSAAAALFAGGLWGWRRRRPQ